MKKLNFKEVDNNKKKFIFKVLHILGYISTFSILILFIVSFVNSCSNSKQEIEENNNDISLIEHVENNLINNNGVYNVSPNDLFNYDFWYIFLNYCNSNFNQGSYYNCNNLFGSSYLMGFAYNQNLNNSIFIRDTPNNESSMRYYTYTSNSINFYKSSSVSYPYLRISFSSIDGSHYYNTIRAYVFTSSSVNTQATSYTSYENHIQPSNSTLITALDNYISSSGGYTQEEVDELTSEYYENGYNEGYSEGYEEGNSIGLIEGYEEGYNVGYETAEGYYKEDLSEINITYDYDFRLLISRNIDINTGLLYMDLQSSNDNEVINYNLGGLTFSSGGKQFNCIRLVLISCGRDNTYFYIQDNTTNVKTAYELYGNDYKHYYMFAYAIYCNIDSNGNIINNLDSITTYYGYIVRSGINSDGYTIVGSYDMRYPSFSSNTFRKLKIINDSGDLVNTPVYPNKYSLSGLLLLDNNSVNSNQGTANVFNLFSMAFGSFTGLLNIAILPNITLGILLFLPLIAAIIVIVLRMVKK